MINYYQNRTLILGVLDVTLYLELSMQIYSEITKCLIKYFKKVKFEDLTQEVVSNLNFTEELPKRIDIMIHPTIMDLLSERATGNYTAFSKTRLASSLIMLANTPQPISITSFQIDIADKWTWFGILASIFSVSFILSIPTFRYKTSKKQFFTKTFLSDFFKYLWESTMIIFFEPFGNISRRISQRIICGVWILACVVIVSEIGGAMKSKYSFVDYKHIKDISQIIPGSPWRPRCLDGQSIDRLLRLMALKDPNFKNIVDKMDPFSVSDLIGSSFYQNMKEHDVMFNSKYIFDYSIGTTVSLGVIDKADLPLFYASEPIRELYFVYPISLEISKDRTFVKLLDFFMSSMIETQWLEKYLAQNTFHVESKMWHPQTTETDTISYEDVIPVFKLFACGQLISAITLLFECVISYYCRKLQLGLKSEQKLRDYVIDFILW